MVVSGSGGRGLAGRSALCPSAERPSVRQHRDEDNLREVSTGVASPSACEFRDYRTVCHAGVLGLPRDHWPSVSGQRVPRPPPARWLRFLHLAQLEMPTVQRPGFNERPILLLSVCACLGRETRRQFECRLTRGCSWPPAGLSRSNRLRGSRPRSLLDKAGGCRAILSATRAGGS